VYNSRRKSEPAHSLLCDGGVARSLLLACMCMPCVVYCVCVPEGVSDIAR